MSNTPLRIYCKNCGAPAGFDIINQTYRCPFCGRLSGIQDAKQEVYAWRQLQKERIETKADVQNLEEHNCPSCGALFVFRSGEASQTCDFCGSKLIRREFSCPEQMPELIIPFFITPEEARQRMLDWGHKNQKTPEGRSVVSSMNKLHGCYLPYQLVRGPVYGTVTRDGTARKYQCAGYLEGTAVNTSRQLDNLVLNGIEPFDWSQSRPFEYGYISGQNVKLTDISDAEIDSRIREEAAADFLPEVEKVMQTSGVTVQTETGNIDTLSVLLPVYFIKSGKLTAVMNGQTGRISVSKSRKKKSNPWMLEPLLYTLLATLLSGSFYRFSLFPLLLFGFVFACIFFAVMGDGRRSLIRSVMLRSEAAKARREDGELKIDESRDILKNPYDNTPVFYEINDQGQTVPVKVRFYSFGRWLYICTNTFVLVFLPALIAALLRLAQMEPWEAFTDGYRIGYGAVWYVLAGFLAILYLAKGVRRDVYDHPILYEILPDGRKRLIGKRSDRRISVLAMFGVGKRESNGKKLTLFRLIGAMGGMGIFLLAVVLITLVGSIAAIIS